ADDLFDHVLTFEDTPNEEPVDAEELYIAAEEVDASDEKLQIHLLARSLDDLESKARRAASRSANSGNAADSASVKTSDGAASSSVERPSSAPADARVPTQKKRKKRRVRRES